MRETEANQSPRGPVEAALLRYTFAFNFFAWLPVFFLYLSDQVSLAGAIRLEAIYYFAVVIWEVPSGYLADRFGRATMLRIAAILAAIAYGFFALGGEFWIFVLAQATLGAAFAFNSGTESSLLFDELASRNEGERYAEAESHLLNLQFQAVAWAVLIGGAAAAAGGYRAAYIVSICAALVAVWQSFHLKDAHQSVAQPVLQQLRAIGSYLNIRIIFWCFVFMILMVTLVHIPYEFVQPYLAVLIEQGGYPSDSLPIASGLLLCATMFTAAWVARKSPSLVGKFNAPGMLAAAAALGGLLCLVMSLAIHPILALAFIVRSAPRALSAPVVLATVSPLLEARHRATFLSVQSLAGRLSFSLVLIGLTAFVSDRPTNEALPLLLGTGFVIGLLAVVVALGPIKTCLNRTELS